MIKMKSRMTVRFLTKATQEMAGSRRQGRKNKQVIGLRGEEF